MRSIPHSRRISLFNAKPDDLIRLYTRQHVGAYEVAKSVGYFSGQHNFLDVSEDDGIDYTYHKQYEWIADQMRLVVPEFTGERPVWAYPKRPKNRGYYKLRPNMVQITALVPRSRILFSDYDMWHQALNDWWMGESEEEDDAWWESDPRPDPSPTWTRCLNITNPLSCKDQYGGYSDSIQACVDRIYLNEIVSIKYGKN